MRDLQTSAIFAEVGGRLAQCIAMIFRKDSLVQEMALNNFKELNLSNEKTSRTAGGIFKIFKTDTVWRIYKNH